jgi:alpha-1,2-mannosyltransferase
MTRNLPSSSEAAGRHGTATRPRLFLATFVPLLGLYLLTATWTLPYHIDPFSNILPAWNIAETGSFHLDEHTQLADPDYVRNIAWIAPAKDSVASQYPPGAALLAAPLYAVWPEDAVTRTVAGENNPDAAPVAVLVPPLGPAAIVAAVAVAAAMGFLALAFLTLGGSSRMALVAAYVAGLGTSAWSVAADKLWQHGPAMMWIALGIVLAAARPLGSGLAFGFAVLTRPPTALIPAAIGIYRTWKERTLRPGLLIGIGATAGLATFLVYNKAIFGSFSFSAGYGTFFQDEALSTDLVGYARNVLGGAFSPANGFLIWSPFLLVLLPGLRSAWQVAPSWVRGSALGGMLYLLLQYKANRYSGGSGFFAYRYPLEALTAAAPLLYLSFREWVAKRPGSTRVFVWLVGMSVAVHSLGALGLVSM